MRNEGQISRHSVRWVCHQQMWGLHPSVRLPGGQWKGLVAPAGEAPARAPCRPPVSDLCVHLAVTKLGSREGQGAPVQGREMEGCGHRALSEQTLGEKAGFLPSLLPVPTGPHALTRSVLIPGLGPTVPLTIPARDNCWLH